MFKPASYACDLYIRAWGSSSIDVEGHPRVFRYEAEEAKWIVDCLKWCVRAATLGVFSGCALYAASSLGASARTVQILTYSTRALFGGSAAALLAPFAKDIMLGGTVGVFLVGLGYSQLPFPARIAVRPFVGPALAVGAGVGVFAYNFFLRFQPLQESAGIQYLRRELFNDYQARA
jgi:hypothetical protein